MPKITSKRGNGKNRRGRKVRGSKLNENQKGISQTSYTDFFSSGKSHLWYCVEGWLYRAVNYQYVQNWEKSVAKLWTGVAAEYDFQQTDNKIWGCS